LLVDPNELRFGAVRVGQSSPVHRVTLTNVSPRPLNFAGILMHGNDPGDFNQYNDCGSHLAPGSSCEIGVTFTPIAQGERDASVYIGNGPNSTNVLLEGTGTP